MNGCGKGRTAWAPSRCQAGRCYAEAMNKFNKSATAFMEHVHLLTEARTANQEAMSVGTELRHRLDAGDKSLLDLMTQLEQVVSAHSGEPPLDGNETKREMPSLSRLGIRPTSTCVSRTL